MKDILFNSHDVVLMLAVGLSLILAGHAACSGHLNRTGRTLLAAFFLMNAFVAIDTLLFWGESVKYAAFTIAPWLPMAFAFASFVIGPLLYWFVKATISSTMHPVPVLQEQKTAPKNPVKAISYLHFLPALVTPLYLYWACFRHPLEYQAELVLGLSIFSEADTYFLFFLTLKKLAPVIYGGLCVGLILHKTRFLAQSSTNEKRLPHLYMAFPIIWLWGLLTHVLGQWQPVAVVDAMGIFTNYMNFTLTLALLLPITAASVRATSAGSPATAETSSVKEDNLLEEAPAGTAASEDGSELINLSEKIARFVEQEKPYLNPQLTLDRFAAMLHLSPRQVSAAINSCFRQNFNGYINSFRVEEARRLLHDPNCQNMTVIEIAQRAGFSSKATFNRLFKSLTGTPPHLYRVQASSSMAVGQLRKVDA